MWNKKIINDLVCWGLFEKTIYKYIPSTSDIVDYLNDDDEKRSLNYGIPCEEIVSEHTQLPSGIYKYKKFDSFGAYYLVEHQLTAREGFIELDCIKPVINDFNIWLESKKVYDDLSMPYRRGVMLYGPPGTGKTSVTHTILESIDCSDKLVIFVDRAPDLSYINKLKKDSRLKIFVVEEFTNLLGRSWECPDDVLDFLDGETSLDNCFTIATTNYPEKLPGNIVERPGRFDKFYKVGELSANDIRCYLDVFKIEPDNKILNSKITIAQLKELVLMILRDKMTMSEAQQKLENHKALAEAEFKDRKKVGFND